MNEFEHAGRMNKAWAIVRWLREHGLDQDARHYQAEDWKTVAHACGVNPPSGATVTVVLELCHQSN